MFDNDHNICTVLEVTLACPVCVTLTGVESKAKARQRTLVPFQYKRLGKATMNLDFEKSLCLGSGIAFGFLLIFISVSNGFIMIVLYKNPLRCFRKSFSMFLVFIAAVDLFIGTVVCSGEAVIRLLCAFGDGEITQDGDVVRVLGYFGINSSILLATAMSVDRLIAIGWPYFYRHKITPRNVVLFNTFICVFSSIFASLQFTGVSMDIYRITDVHLHTTFPLTTTTLAYLAIFFFLRKRARFELQKETISARNSKLRDIQRIKNAQTEKKIASTSFLILLLLIISLLPYFAVILLYEKCNDCGKRGWFIAFRESSTVFLFLNSTVNPLLTTFRINELKHSVKFVLGLTRRRVKVRDGNGRPQTLVNPIDEKEQIKAEYTTQGESKRIVSEF